MWDPVAGRGKEFGGGKEALVSWCTGGKLPQIEFGFEFWFEERGPGVGTLVQHSLEWNLVEEKRPWWC